jgi:hypothetical protein
VVSHGWHHHNRLSVVSVPSSSGLNARAGSQQNRHAGPAPPRPWIHPVVLAVAACIPSNLGVLFTLVLHDRTLVPKPTAVIRDPPSRLSLAGTCCGPVGTR